MKLSVYLKIGTKMKNLRKEKGISQKKMAERLNLIPSAYSNYENLICEIPVEVMQKFCEEVECSMEELIEFDIGNLDEVHPVSSLSDLIADFHNSVDEYLKWCEDEGRKPEKAYKGSFNIRISPKLHKQLVICAMSHDMTLNGYIQEILEKAVVL